MKKTVLALKHCATGGIAVLFLLFFAAVVSAQEAKTWQNEITLYGWYSGIDGTLQLPSGAGTDVEIEASDILDNLSMIFMGGYTGKYDR